MRIENPRLAVVYSLLAALIYAIWGLTIKTLAAEIPNPMIVFFGQLFSLFFLVPVFSIKGVSVKTRSFPLHLLRTFVSLSAMFCLYYALKFLPLVDVLLLTYTRPLFIPFIVFVWFGKKWTKQTFLGLLIGFLGVILILKPTERVFDIAALIGLASGFLGAIAFTAIRRLTKTEPTNRIIFYYLILSIPLTAIALAWGSASLNWHTVGILLLIGFISILYQYFLTKAYRYAKAFKVGSILYSTIIFGAFLEWIFLKDLSLDIPSIVGMLLIILGSIIVMRITEAN